jgi:hypothetical protein
VGGFFVDVIVGYMVRAISNAWRSGGSAKWAVVEAIVTADPIKSSGYGGTSVEIVYSYRFQGELYTGLHEEPCFLSDSEYMERFAKGRTFTVRIKPDEPEVSVVLDDDQADGIRQRLERIDKL